MSTFELRLPESLHEHAKKLAEQHETSLDQFITVAGAEKGSAIDTAASFEQRAVRGDRAAIEQMLAKVRNVPPTEGDGSHRSCQTQQPFRCGNSSRNAVGKQLSRQTENCVGQIGASRISKINQLANTERPA